MKERGVSEAQVYAAIRNGQKEQAQRGLSQYKLNLEFNREWDGRFYRVQQVVPIVAEEPGKYIVVTVYAFYFQEGEER